MRQAKKSDMTGDRVRTSLVYSDVRFAAHGGKNGVQRRRSTVQNTSGLEAETHARLQIDDRIECFTGYQRHNIIPVKPRLFKLPVIGKSVSIQIAEIAIVAASLRHPDEDPLQPC